MVTPLNLPNQQHTPVPDPFQLWPDSVSQACRDLWHTNDKSQCY